ncbi:MAG: DUF1343 domain-containing protein [Phycisphaerae bacterium]|nr:DUF1343 domain-containing protein [Phycisphaerae bacterium]
MIHGKPIAITLACLICLNAGCVQGMPARTGLDRITEYTHVFHGKRVGLIANQTAVNSAGQSIVDVFMALPDCHVKALFAPEHGLWGAQAAGANVDTVTHPTYGMPVYSLYRNDGRMPKPTTDMLASIDILVFDIQDIGARFYTYIWTMALAMEAAAENHIPFVVLDRPNPIAGIPVQGPVLDGRFSSFVGLYPIPVVHNMTVAELAKLFNGAGWLSQGVKADLTVIPMTDWSHTMAFEQTGQTFVPPSPNMRSVDTARVYPGLCLLEGTNVSEGRGTDLPFLQFGAPWLDARHLCRTLMDLKLPGVRFESTTFTPTASKYQGQLCQGLRLHITDRTQLEPFILGVHIIQEIHDQHAQNFQWRASHFDRLCGTDHIRQAILNDQPVGQIQSEWQPQLAAFRELRKTCLLYADTLN